MSSDEYDGTTYENLWDEIRSAVTSIFDDLRDFMKAMENIEVSETSLIDIQEKQRKRTIQDNRYKYTRPNVKSDYRAYRHQAR